MKEIWRIKRYLKGHVALAVGSLLCALLSVSSKMAIPFLAGLAIQQLKDGSFDISLYLVLIAVFLVTGSLFRYLFDLFTAILGQAVVKKMRDEVFSSYNRVSLSYIDGRPHGDLLLSLINDIENVQTGLISGAGALYEGVFQILVTLVFMFYLNWLLALAVVLLSPLSIVVSRFVSNHNTQYFKEQNKKTGQLTAFCLESLNNFDSSLSYGLEKKREEDFEKINSSLRASNFKATFAVGWINPSTRLVNNVIYAAIAFLGATLIIYPLGNVGLAAFNVGALTSFLIYVSQYTSPFNEISNVASEVSYATSSLKRIDELIATPSDINEGKALLSGSIDSLKADHIDFSYDGKRQIIKDFDIDIYKGHKIALVGPTGCGKTTIINLLLRFYDPQKGCFILNDIKSPEIPKNDLRSHIGMVLQDTCLFHMSIRDNIAYGKPNASFEEVVEAAKKADADSFIRQLPDGYETIVSNGSGLSTGEKQLLCVARIILLKPEVVVLDEATSNIDLRTEMLLGKSFDELMKGKTSIVVAHRLSTIKNADLILVLKDGELIEQGNFQELLTKNGFFKGLYDSQFA